MEYSYFIKRNIKFFNNNGYTLYPNGNQVYKRIGDYDVLITDYTGKKLSLDLLVVFELWIKNNITDVLIFRKMYKRTFFCPKIEKIDKEIAKIIGSSDISSDTAVMQCIKSQSKVFLVPKSIGISFHYFNLVINTFNFSR